jgi:hypothetical protein
MAARSALARYNGRAIDEPVELKTLIVNSKPRERIYGPVSDLSMVNLRSGRFFQ